MNIILMSHKCHTFRPFGSFRLKKRSSTLGINKTSESPPRQIVDNDYSEDELKYARYDPHFRTSVQNFDRSASCNTSLHNIDIRKNLDFSSRNSRYRSTIQGSSLDTPILRNRITGGRPGLTPG